MDSIPEFPDNAIVAVGRFESIRPFLQLPAQIDFPNGTSIRSRPDSFSRIPFEDFLGPFAGKDFLHAQRFLIAHAGLPEEPSFYRVANSSMLITVLSLWLAKPSLVSIAQILYFENTSAEINFKRFEQLTPFDQYGRHALSEYSPDDLDLARTFVETISQLSLEGTTWRAIYSLWQALRESDWTTRLLQYWAGLESLYSPSDQQELSFRISQRSCFFLAHDLPNIEETFRTTRRAYKWRSRVTHGRNMTGLSQQESQIVAYHSEDILRLSLRKILSDQKLLGVFESKKRDDYLDSLVFSRERAPA